MKLDRDEWAQVLGLLDTALGLPDAARTPWLAALALEPAHLKTALRELIEDRRAIETADFLGRGAGPAAQRAGDAIGPWRLVRPLGEGGMASVWLAERADGAHLRQVALKLPHRGLASRTLGERFERERAILSTLDHPHIAQVLDAGTDGTQPWLAMEFVDGQRITRHAAALAVRAKLRLFLQVLQAVQHAHAQLVIHRDLKPANVLVTSAGEVKLLDFGVAKLLHADGATADTALTQLGGRAMTPQYASPEQVSGRPLGVASDVYALGVLLYELLTGQLPYKLQRDTAAALEEAILGARIVRPSLAAQDPTTARALRGDVDTIVLKALQADPARRYASAAAMADDVERHLQARPIAARPPSAGYRLRKLWQRRKIVLSAGLVVTLALAAGLGAVLWQSQRARDEARRAQAVQRFLVTLLQTTDPQRGQSRDLAAGELLDLNAARIDTEFADQPDTRAQLLHTLANIYVERGEPAKARPLLQRATTLYAAAGASARGSHVQALVDMGELLDELGELAAEREVLHEAAALAERHFGAPHRWSAPLLVSLAWIEFKEGRLDQARRLGIEARGLFGTPTPQSLRASGSLATIDIALGDLASAQALLEQAVRDGARLGGQGTVDGLMDVYNLARVRYILGDYARAEADLRRALPRFDAVAGVQHERTLLARGLLAQTLAERGQLEAAVAEARAALAAARARGADDDAQVDAQRATLARMLRLAGRADEALPLARQAQEAADRKAPNPTGQREAIRRVLAEALLAAGRRDEGLQTLDAAQRNVQALSTAGPNLLTPEIALMQAVAARDTSQAGEGPARAGVACDALAKQRPAGSLPLLRCRAVEQWLQAGTAPPPDAAAARARFTAARERLFAAGLHERHPLRAELLAAEAELLAADGHHAVAAAALLARADLLYRADVGQPLPRPLLVLH